MGRIRGRRNKERGHLVDFRVKSRGRIVKPYWYVDVGRVRINFAIKSPSPLLLPIPM
jgi:hypothetical protein